VTSPRRPPATFCGLTPKIFCLLFLIGIAIILLFAVIALAVTTGIMVRRASAAEARLADMSASLASALANLPTATATTSTKTL
jgi:hypothetical protein